MPDSMKYIVLLNKSSISMGTTGTFPSFHTGFEPSLAGLAAVAASVGGALAFTFGFVPTVYFWRLFVLYW